MVRRCWRQGRARDTDARGFGHQRILGGASSAGVHSGWVPPYRLRPARFGRKQPNEAGEQPGGATDDQQAHVEHMSLDPVQIVGTAAGAAPSIDYALSHPERLRSLVIADCTGGVQDPEHLEMLERIRPPEFQALPVWLREVGACYRGANPEGTRRWIEIAETSNEEAAARQRPRNHVTYALLATLRVPTLAIAGGADQTTPPIIMRAIAKHIPNCRYEPIAEAGHASFWEQPEVWNHLVLDFIGRQ
ncbi:MAG: alpha/beta fold hydrolase [Chloroflexota bacterium]